MSAYTRKQVRKPPAVYGLARWLIRFFCYFVLGYRVTYGDAVPARGPLMVIGSHAGMMDALFMAAAIRNRRLSFVTTERFFRTPFIGGLFRFFGVIPRIQFQADPRSISAMLRVIGDGGAVGLFPAGQTSMCGTPGGMPRGIARLLQRSGATVVALRIHGSFLTKSRFQSGFNRGRVAGEVSVLFTPQQLETATEDQVYRAVCNALWYDDYAWQERTGTRFKGPGLARGYQQVLIRCPRCGAEYRMVCRGDIIQCQACGNGARVGRNMHMTPLGPDDRIFPTLRDWYSWQAAQLYAAIDDRETPFRLETPVRAQLYRGARLVEAGDGTLWLDREHIGFDGTLEGQPAAFRIAHRSLFGMAADTGAYLELYHPNLGPVRLLPPNGLVIVQFKAAQEYLHGQG